MANNTVRVSSPLILNDYKHSIRKMQPNQAGAIVVPGEELTLRPCDNLRVVVEKVGGGKQDIVYRCIEKRSGNDVIQDWVPETCLVMQEASA